MCFYEASATVKMYNATVVRQSWYLKPKKPKHPYWGFAKTPSLTYTFGVWFWVFGGWSLETPRVFCWWLRDQSRSPAHYVGRDLPFFTSLRRLVLKSSALTEVCVRGGTRRLSQFKLVLRAGTSEVVLLDLADWEKPREKPCLQGPHKPLQVLSSHLSGIWYLHVSSLLLSLTNQIQQLSCRYCGCMGFSMCLYEHFSEPMLTIRPVCGWPSTANSCPNLNFRECEYIYSCCCIYFWRFSNNYILLLTSQKPRV